MEKDVAMRGIFGSMRQKVLKRDTPSLGVLVVQELKELVGCY